MQGNNMEEKIDEWLKKAEEDLEGAEYNYKGEQFKIAAFLCQQSVEKALKALYIKKFRKLLKVHDLFLLGKSVDAPDNILEICKELTNFYIETRYPGVIARFDQEIVELAIEKVHKVLEWVSERLS